MKKKESLKEQVYKKIKEKIINNEFRPNAPIDENTLCEMLNVSRTPIREALNRLERENFVTLIPQKGARVSDLSIQSIVNIFRVRKAVEPNLIKLACYDIENDKDRLLELKSRMQDAIETENTKELHATDYEFHTFLYTRSDNPILVSIMQLITDHFQRVRTQEVDVLERSITGAHQHIEMIDALVSGDIDKIPELILKHINTNEDYFIKSFFKR